MFRSLRVRMFLSLVTFGFVLIFTVPQVFGRTPPTAVQAIAHPQALLSPHAALTGALQLYHPLFTKAYYGNDSSVYVQNLGTSPANYTLNFSTGVSYTPPVLAPGESAMISAADVISLPTGFTGNLMIVSTQPMQSLQINRAATGIDQMYIYNGIPAAAAATDLRFSPFVKSTTGMSAITVQNIGTSVANLTFYLYDSSGSLVLTYPYPSPINPGGGVVLVGPITFVTLPNGTYSLRVSSTTPIVGILQYTSNDTTERWFRPAMTINTGSTSGVNYNYVPRFYRSAVGVDGTRSTRLTLLNTGTVAANASVLFYNITGTLTFSNTQSIAAGGMAFVDPAATLLPAGFAGSAVVSSDQPLGLTELTTYDSGGTTVPRTSNADSYMLTSPAIPSLMPSFPYLAFGTGEQTVVHAQNVTTQTTDLQLMLSGGFVGTYPRVAPNASARFGTVLMAGAGSYTGMGTITTNALVSVLVDIEGAFPAPPTTPTMTATPTPTLPGTPVATLTATPVITMSATPTAIPGVTLTPTWVITGTVTPATPTAFPVGTLTPTPVITGTITLTPTPVITGTGTPIATSTALPVGTPTDTPVITGTITPATPTPVGTLTATPVGTISATPTSTTIPATPTATLVATISATPMPGTPTATAIPATQIPTPTAAGGSVVTPTLYLNYLLGAPGSVFVVTGYNYPPGSSVDLLVNGLVAANVTADGSGGFSLLLQTPSGALPGFYVVTAVVHPIPVAALSQASTTAPQFGVFHLVTSGEGAVVRVAPPGAPTTKVDVPTAAAANPLASPPYTYLPLIRR